MNASKSARVAIWCGAGVSAALLALWWIADHRRGLAWAIATVKARFPDVPQIGGASLAAWLADATRPAPLLLDARSAEEFAVSHLRGAQRIDPDTPDEEILALLPKGRPLVAYCAAGYRGSALARRLRALGFEDAANLAGGIFHWANEGREVCRDGRVARAVHPFSRVFARLLHPSRR